LDPPIASRGLPPFQKAGRGVRGGIGPVILSGQSQQDVVGGVLISWNPDALEQALYDRAGDLDGLVHHSDRGTQYLSIRYTERLAEAGIAPSVGSRGDSYDNALAESVIGLFKTEVIWRRGPWRTMEDVEFATLEWVDWFNTKRLLGPIGYVPPAEYEAVYHQQQLQPPAELAFT
jgi:transposase InsO family protein